MDSSDHVHDHDVFYNGGQSDIETNDSEGEHTSTEPTSHRGHPSNMSRTHSQDRGDDTKMNVQSPPAPTTAIERVADRAISIQSTNTNSFKTILDSAIKESNTITTTYLVDPDVLLPQMKKLYTGGQDRIEIFLKFMADEVEVCPHDNHKRLMEWGSPSNLEFCTQLESYARRIGSTSILKIKSWTKTTRTLFTAFAKIIWPHKSSSVKIKRRCLYGIRLKQDFGDRPSNTPQTPRHTPVHHQRRMSLDSLSSQSTGRSITPRPSGMTNSRRRDQFTPYYDILENNHCYVIRLVLPLMDPRDAKSITFNCNLAKKRLDVSGSYIPGCHIGEEAHTQFRIQTPLLSVIHSPTHTTGWFDLHIPLPTDVKDDETELNITHVSWGIAVYLPRRKTINTVHINFASCFGSVNVAKESPRSSSSTNKTTSSTKSLNHNVSSSTSDNESINENDGIPTRNRSDRKKSSDTPIKTSRRKRNSESINEDGVTPTRNRSGRKKSSDTPIKTSRQKLNTDSTNEDGVTLTRNRSSRRKIDVRSSEGSTTKRKRVHNSSPTKETTDSSTRNVKRSRRLTTNTNTLKDNLIGRTSCIPGQVFGKRYSHRSYEGTIASYDRRRYKEDNKDYDYYQVSIPEDTTVHQFFLSDLLQFGFITEEEFHNIKDEYQC